MSAAGGGSPPKPPAAASEKPDTFWNFLTRPDTNGRFGLVDFSARGPSASNHEDAEAPVQHADPHIPRGRRRAVPEGTFCEAADLDCRDFASPEVPEAGGDRLRQSRGLDGWLETHRGWNS